MSAPRQRGAVLVLVLIVLTMLTLLGTALSRMASARWLSVRAWQAEAGSALSGLRGGDIAATRASIEGGANGAPSIEGLHGPQAIYPGGDDRLGRGIDREGHGAGRDGGSDIGSGNGAAAGDDAR